MTSWTVTRQAPLSVRFPRQEYWSGLPFPSPGDLPNPGIELMSPALAGRVFTTEPPGSPIQNMKVKVLVAQSCLTLCDHMDYSQPGSSVHGILRARILEKVAILFSRESSQRRDQTQVSCIAGRFFPVRATREAPYQVYYLLNLSLSH